MDGSDLKILPTLMFEGALQVADQEVNIFGRVTKWLAMIREWQRHEAAPCEPAIDVTKYHAIL